METNENKKKEITLALLGGLFLLILVIGAAYSYFQVVANNNTSATTITGNSELVGQATLTTNISSLKLNITAEMMHSSNVNTTYYATESGTPVTTPTEGSGIYTLATASITESEVTVDCSYTYDISATVSKTITDGSDANYKVVITESNGTETAYTLAEIISGVTHTRLIKELTYGTDQTIKIKAYVTNTESIQNDLSGNTITITITPKSGTEGFSCDTTQPTAAEELIASGELWNSGLEGDGYRYYGTGEYQCSYNNGNYVITGGISGCSAATTDDNWDEVTLDTGGQTEIATAPSNYICFGTSDATECKNNEAKYMYRIIGVFEGSDGKQHLKLISLKQLGTYAWNSSNSDVNWSLSTLYSGLNGSYFLTNTTYDYLQNNTWLNKIEDWTWSAVNTKTASDSGPDYSSITTQEMYLHEMNRSSKTSSIGEWSTPTAKIGLMYASDYQMSLGSSSLSYIGSSNESTLKTGWMHQSNNDTTSSSHEWTLSRYGDISGDFYAWRVTLEGSVHSTRVDDPFGARPVFHLTSDARISSGNGSYSNPYILK